MHAPGRLARALRIVLLLACVVGVPARAAADSLAWQSVAVLAAPRKDVAPASRAADRNPATDTAAGEPDLPAHASRERRRSAPLTVLRDAAGTYLLNCSLLR